MFPLTKERLKKTKACGSEEPSLPHRQWGAGIRDSILLLDEKIPFEVFSVLTQTKGYTSRYDRDICDDNSCLILIQGKSKVVV